MHLPPERPPRLLTPAPGPARLPPAAFPGWGRGCPAHLESDVVEVAGATQGGPAGVRGSVGGPVDACTPRPGTHRAAGPAGRGQCIGCRGAGRLAPGALLSGHGVLSASTRCTQCAPAAAAWAARAAPRPAPVSLRPDPDPNLCRDSSGGGGGRGIVGPGSSPRPSPARSHSGLGLASFSQWPCSGGGCMQINKPGGGARKGAWPLHLQWSCDH